MTAYYYDKDHILKRSRLRGLEGALFKKPVNPGKLRAMLMQLRQKAIQQKAEAKAAGPRPKPPPHPRPRTPPSPFRNPDQLGCCVPRDFLPASPVTTGEAAARLRAAGEGSVVAGESAPLPLTQLRRPGSIARHCASVTPHGPLLALAGLSVGTSEPAHIWLPRAL